MEKVIFTKWVELRFEKGLMLPNPNVVARECQRTEAVQGKWVFFCLH